MRIHLTFQKQDLIHVQAFKAATKYILRVDNKVILRQ